MIKSNVPVPLISEKEEVDWFFAFKFNSQTYGGCNDDGKFPKPGSKGIFGGSVQAYKREKDNRGNIKKQKDGTVKKIPLRFGQQYIFASSMDPVLKKGQDCLGTTLHDPVGATFAQVYLQNKFYYLIWNDQFYGDPNDGMGKMVTDKNGNRKWENRDIPWGHSKGMLAWNEEGNGFVLQVSTPSWPASGSKKHPRKKDGNTLGCVKDDDVEVSQHFYCSKINRNDLVIILNALINASVVTDPKDPQICRNGGPANVQSLVNKVGVLSSSLETSVATLSNGVKVISKPSMLKVPPWQLVSAKLGALPLRVASWWANPAIYSTTAKTKFHCWAEDLGKPGPVEIALSGKWEKKIFGFQGTPSPKGNHAKIAVSTNRKKAYCIFGDMNQMGTLNKRQDDRDPSNKELTCDIHQNGRGGLFYVFENKKLFNSITDLLSGDTAPLRPPAKKLNPAKKKSKPR